MTNEHITATTTTQIAQYIQFYVIDTSSKIALCLYCFMAVSVDDIAKKKRRIINVPILNIKPTLIHLILITQYIELIETITSISAVK